MLNLEKTIYAFTLLFIILADLDKENVYTQVRHQAWNQQRSILRYLSPYEVFNKKTRNFALFKYLLSFQEDQLHEENLSESSDDSEFEVLKKRRKKFYVFFYKF